MKNIKPDPLKINPADPTEQGQRILANIIASAYLRTKKDSHAASQVDCITKAMRLRNSESLP